MTFECEMMCWLMLMIVVWAVACYIWEDLEDRSLIDEYHNSFEHQRENLHTRVIKNDYERQNSVQNLHIRRSFSRKLFLQQMLRQKWEILSPKNRKEN